MSNNQPMSGNDMPRFAGPGTMMRLPAAADAAALDAAFIGVPLDIGTSNRPGARYGPQEIRKESALIRPHNMATGAAPFDSLQVADLGDVATNPYDLQDALATIRERYDEIVSSDCIPLTLGGDHTLVLPVLRAMRGRYGPVALIHVDAHADTNDTMFGEKYAHGTPIRRAVEEGLLRTDLTVQIGLRGTGYSPEDFEWSREQGFEVVTARQCWHRSLADLMVRVVQRIGDAPAYLSFDIDAIDPAFAPGTGTPEIAGLTSIQAVEIITGCRSLDIVGCDLVEVAPAYDRSGSTSLLAANLLFEMLCTLPGVTHD